MKNKQLFVIILILCGLVLGVGRPAQAVQMTWNSWWKAAGTSISFTHEDKDVASFERDGTIDYESPTYIHTSQGEVSQNAEVSANSADAQSRNSGSLDGITVSSQPDASAASGLKSDTSVSERISMEINLNTGSDTAYSISAPPPQHSVDAPENVRDPDAPENPEAYDYYNNWEITTASAYAYGAYQGEGNLFSVDDGDGIAGEEFLITGEMAFEYDLNGTWTYETDETDGYDERTGYFWTSFTFYLKVYEGARNADGSNTLLLDSPVEYYDEMKRDDTINTAALDNTVVNQSTSGNGVYEFSFLVTEGIAYEFDLYAALYGRADGIASHYSNAQVTLDFSVTDAPVGENPSASPTPEPATWLLMSLGLTGLGVCRRRVSRG